MSLLMMDGTAAEEPGAALARKGLVRAEGKVVRDDDGIFHPLGLTFFWALYGWKYERERVLAHLKWLATKRFDYLRILGEVDWEGRTIDPYWPDYSPNLHGFIDAAYDHGMRTEMTMIGGRQFDEHGNRRFVPTDLARQISSAYKGREHKLMLYEMANEWSRLDKASPKDLIMMGQIVERETPNLVSLSCPDPEGMEQMMNATEVAGASSYTLHPRRSSHDHGWSHVRQGYDFRLPNRTTWNNEPEGPQSSVVSMDNPLQLACCRLLGIICGGAGYVLHVGQGVTGKADPAHGRPENMWQVPNIDNIMDTVRKVDELLPLTIENWKCVNNGRPDHPLPLDPVDGFWEGGANDRAPAVNKNYAAIAGDQFIEILTGVKSEGAAGRVHAGRARRRCLVQAFNPVTRQIEHEATLSAGEDWYLPGRGDTMMAYLIKGRYL
jgi:hypothetical protein